MLVADMEARHIHGIKLYGMPLQPHNGRNPWIDAYQEALDQCVYLMQAQIEASNSAIRLTADACLDHAIKQAHDLRAVIDMLGF